MNQIFVNLSGSNQMMKAMFTIDIGVPTSDKRLLIICLSFSEIRGLISRKIPTRVSLSWTALRPQFLLPRMDKKSDSLPEAVSTRLFVDTDRTIDLTIRASRQIAGAFNFCSLCKQEEQVSDK